MNQPRPRRRPGAAVALAVAAALALTACGTRLSADQAADQLASADRGAGAVQPGGTALQAANGSGIGTGTGGTAGGTAAGEAGTAAGGTGTTSGPSGAVSGPAGPAVAGTPAKAGGTDGSSAGGGAAPGGTGGTAPGATGGSGGATGSTGSTGSTGGTTADAGGPKAPIKIGLVGNFSGVVGGVSAASRDAASAWAQATNAKGGVDGHKIELLVADDGNSAANDIGNVRRLVEQEGAIAILNFYPAAGGADAVGKYARDKGIAIVGGSGYEAAWNQYPNMFPATTGDTPQDVAWALAMKESGATKVGSFHCTEAPVCADKEKIWAAAAKKLGLQVVYQGTGSLAQPDFTSICTAARSAGAQAVVTIVDGNSTLRYARDCARQQYKQTIVIPNPSNTVTPAIEGAYAPIASFPWFLTSGTPALDEYGAAVKKYTKSFGTFSAAGWTHGKMLEKALTGHVSNPPTPADVLTGLQAFHDETLGGLSQPLNFTKGKPSPAIPCAWKAVVKGGKWTAPSGTKPTYCP